MSPLSYSFIMKWVPWLEMMLFRKQHWWTKHSLNTGWAERKMPIYRRCLFQWGSTAACFVTKSLNLINLSPVTALCLCCPIRAHLTHKITRVFSAGLLFWVIIGTQILWYMFLKVYQHLCLRPTCYQIFLFFFPRLLLLQYNWHNSTL